MLLPEPEAPTSAHRLAWRDEQEKSAAPARRQVADRADHHLTGSDVEVARAGPLGDDRVGVEDLEDPLRRGTRLRRHCDDLGEHADGRAAARDTSRRR